MTLQLTNIIGLSRAFTKHHQWFPSTKLLTYR